MSDILNFNVVRALDLDGYPVPGAQARFFDSGTDTERAVFADPDGSVQHPSPLLADAEGVFPPVFVLGGSSVRAEVRDADGVMVTGYPLDPAIRVAAGGSGASQVSFNPTGDIPATDVQAAIEKVQANLVAPLLAGGIGVTGNAPLLESLDATNTASGFYRYDGTTTGTFPAGVTKANGGIVELLRRTSGAAEMTIYPASDAAFYWRELSTTWGVWSRLPLTASEAEAQAGTNNTNYMTPLRVEQHMLANGLGWGQTWQDVKASRAVSTSYQNTTGRPIMIALSGLGGGGEVQVSTNNSTWVTVGRLGQSGFSELSANIIVPAGHYYRQNGGSLPTDWAELR